MKPAVSMDIPSNIDSRLVFGTGSGTAVDSCRDCGARPHGAMESQREHQ